MPGSPRMTIPTQLVLRALLEDPTAEQYGVQIGTAAGLPSGTVHPMLARLERIGWVQSRWEEIDPSAAGRPPRRYYRLTSTGVELARNALARTYQNRVAPLRARPIGEQP